MSRPRSSKASRRPARTGEGERSPDSRWKLQHDDRLGLDLVFLELSRADYLYLLLVFETYEDVAVVRTVDPQTPAGDIAAVLLIAPDFREVALAALAGIAEETGLRCVGASVAAIERLRAELPDRLPD